jgi:hypothetical protein
MQHREPLILLDQHSSRYFVASFGHHSCQVEFGRVFKPKQFPTPTNGYIHSGNQLLNKFSLMSKVSK